MDLTELQAGVVEITARPDLVNLTLSAVQNATLKAHRADFFVKDKTVVVFDPGSELYEHRISTLTGFVRFRKMSTARLYDLANQVQGAPFVPIDPENINDSYDLQKPRVFFEAGDHVIFRSSAAFRYIYCTYYTVPIVAADGFTSWIADQYPWAIVHEAAAQVFRAIGQLEKFRTQRDLVGQEYQIITQDQLLSVGY